MSDPKQTTDQKDNAPKRTVDEIDFSRPISIILHQTASRNTFEIFTGENHASDAATAASKLALDAGKTVAVFGPQNAVKVPPQAPQADDLELQF